MGNNGGDGLVIARYLFENDYMTSTYVVHFSDKMSDDFVTNFKRAEEIGINPVNVHSTDDFPIIDKEDLVIDAIFGIGLKRTPNGFTKYFIKYLNSLGATVISIDMPSGLFAEGEVEDKEIVLVYPNPGNGIYNLKINSQVKPDKVSYSVYSIYGELIVESKILLNHIDLSKVGKGLYYLQINLDNETFIKTLIIQ